MFDYQALLEGKIPVLDYYLPAIVRRHERLAKENPFLKIEPLNLAEVVNFIEQVKADTYARKFYTGEIESTFLNDHEGFVLLKNSPLKDAFEDCIEIKLEQAIQNKLGNDWLDVALKAKSIHLSKYYTYHWTSEKDVDTFQAFCYFFKILGCHKDKIELRVLNSKEFASFEDKEFEKLSKEVGRNWKSTKVESKEIKQEDKVVAKPQEQTRSLQISAQTSQTTTKKNEPNPEVETVVEVVKKEPKKGINFDMAALGTARENILLKTSSPMGRGMLFEKSFANLLNNEYEDLEVMTKKLLRSVSTMSEVSVEIATALNKQKRKEYKHWYLPLETVEKFKGKSVLNARDLIENSGELFESHDFVERDYPLVEVDKKDTLLTIATQLKHDKNSIDRKVDVRLNVPSHFSKTDNEISFSLKTSSILSSDIPIRLFSGKLDYILKALEGFSAFKNYVEGTKNLLRILVSALFLGKSSVKDDLSIILEHFPMGWDSLFKKERLDLDMLKTLYPKEAKRLSSFLKVNAKDFIKYFFEGEGKIHYFGHYLYGKKPSDNVLKVYKMTDVYKKISENDLIKIKENGKLSFAGISIDAEVNQQGERIVVAEISKNWFEKYKITPVFKENFVFKEL